MKSVKLLLFTHLSAFATGIYIGKSLDAEELAAYRSAASSSFYESISSFVKKGVLVCLGVVVITVSTRGLIFRGRLGDGGGVMKQLK